MAIKKAGLIDSMHIIKRKGLRIIRKIGFVGSMFLIKRMNSVYLDSTHIAGARFNHPIKFFMIK